MVHFPDAQGPVGEIAEPCEAIHRLAFLWDRVWIKTYPVDVRLLVSCAPALSMDEGARS